jgi:hypothetical protein
MQLRSLIRGCRPPWNPGDTVTDVRCAGRIIPHSAVRHIWKRSPIRTDGSVCLPWELRYASGRDHNRRPIARRFTSFQSLARRW